MKARAALAVLFLTATAAGRQEVTPRSRLYLGGSAAVSPGPYLAIDGHPKRDEGGSELADVYYHIGFSHPTGVPWFAVGGLL